VVKRHSLDACRPFSDADPQRPGFVGDRDHGGIALLARNVQMVLELVRDELVGAGLHLDEGDPLLLPAGRANQSVREQPPSFPENEGDLDVCLQWACWRPRRHAGAASHTGVILSARTPDTGGENSLEGL